MPGTDETVTHVFKNCRSKEHGFLRDKRDVLSQPSQIQSTHIVTIEKNLTSNWIIKTLYQSYYSRFSASRRTDKRCNLSGGNEKIHILDNLDGGSAGVNMLNATKLNCTLKMLQLVSSFFVRIEW
jgi:hypothetical protein